MGNQSSSAELLSSESFEQTGKCVASANINSTPLPLQQSRNLSQGPVWDIENCPVPSDVRPEDVAGKCMASANINSTPLPLQQSRNLSHGPLAIFWDIENCPVPSDVRPEDVAGSIRMAVRVHPVIRGAVTVFSAYGDFNAFPRKLREGCQRTGVKLIDVPNGRKDAADKAILVDMFLFALDNPPPSSIMLISGDVDFAPALHILGQRGYTVILVIPSGVNVSSALCGAGSFVWDWPSAARGEGFLPPAKAFTQSRGNPMVSRSLTENNSTSVSIPSCPMTSRSHRLPSVIHDVSGGNLASCRDGNLYPSRQVSRT